MDIPQGLCLCVLLTPGHTLQTAVMVLVLCASTVHFGLSEPYAQAWWAVNCKSFLSGAKNEVLQYKEERGFSMTTIKPHDMQYCAT